VRAAVDRVTARDGLSAHRLVTLVQTDVGRFARKSCMHCLEPSCVAACLVGAIRRTDAGPVVYDPDKCIGCRYCMLACPFHVPRYEWDETKPFVKKCDMCADTLRDGGEPACVSACPHEALVFGPRDAMLDLARRRIQDHPGEYVNHVWGETEFGGTSVLYVSDVDLSALDWPATATAPIPELTESLIASTPKIGVGVACGLLGLNWIIGRRMRLAASQVRGPEGEGPVDTEGAEDGE
jgi:formate dehydrogenase iron-sulfur subunit